MGFDPFSMIGTVASGLLNFFGGRSQQDQNYQIAQQQMNLQREFAQNGIQWKVADAQAAGIHPLYALGASTASYSPVSVGTSNTLSPLADMAKNLGNDLTGAMERGSTQPQRAASRAATALAIEGGALDNEEKKLRLENLRLQNQRLNQSLNPAFPIPGDTSRLEFPGMGQGINPEQQKVTAVDPSMPHQMPGSVPDIAWSRTPGGGYSPIPSKEVKESIEDMAPYEWSHFARNLISTQPPFAAPAGKEWVWYWPTFEYRLVPAGRRRVPAFDPGTSAGDIFGRR